MYHVLKCFHRQALMHTHTRTHARTHTHAQSLPFHNGFADGSGSGEAQLTDIRMFRESLTHHRAWSRHNRSIIYSIHQPSIKQLLADNLLYTVKDITFFFQKFQILHLYQHPLANYTFLNDGNVQLTAYSISQHNTTQHGGQIKSSSY